MWSTVKHGDPEHTEEATCVFFDGRLSGMFLVVNVSCLTSQQPENKLQNRAPTGAILRQDIKCLISVGWTLASRTAKDMYLNIEYDECSVSRRTTVYPWTRATKHEYSKSKSEVYGLCLVQSGCHFHAQCPRCVGNKCTFAHLCTPGRVCPKREVWSGALLTLCYLEAA